MAIKALKYLLGFVVLWLVAFLAFTVVSRVTGTGGQKNTVPHGQTADTLLPQDEAGRMLAARGRTLSVAEAGTGGALARCLSSLPGSADYFLGGVVYGVAMRELPDVARDPVSRQAARQMALTVQRTTGSDYTLAVTPIAGPSATGGIAEGTVWIALAGPGGEMVCRQTVCAGAGPESIDHAVGAAVALLHETLVADEKRR